MGSSLHSLELLHPRIREYVERQGWSGLHPIQEKAAQVILKTGKDVVIAAPTSGGKTEAALLPVLSACLSTQAPSFQVLYVAPLKALINDQHKRVSAILAKTGLRVHRWHGDVDNNRKRALRDRPGGVLQITPESIESSLLHFGHRVRHLYGSLRFIIIDELHAFLETERGIHLRSLLSRIRGITSGNPRRIGLSATLADVTAAQRFLRPETPNDVSIIQETGCKKRELRVKTIRDERENDQGERLEPDGALDAIAVDIHRQFHGSTNLVFANSRRTVEAVALRLKELAGADGDYHLHHGSLSRPIRLVTETALKNSEPVNAVCTSSLELGIDIGSIDAVAQIDPPGSVSALVQRCGRSGRRTGQTSSLHLYVRHRVHREPDLTDLLAPELLQAIALVQLMERGWLEPPQSDRFHLSTLVHQSLSLLMQYGGLHAHSMFATLCQTGPFRKVSEGDYTRLLDGLRTRGLIKADPEEYQVLTMQGEKITSAPDFYAAFTTPVELAVRHGSEQIGKLTPVFGLKEGDTILLDARRWEIVSIDWRKRSIRVTSTRVGKPPVFLGQGGHVHTMVYEEMGRILKSEALPSWLDDISIETLTEAREAAVQFGLAESNVLIAGNSIQWFPWVGTRGRETLLAWGELNHLDVDADSLSLHYSCGVRQFRRHLAGFETSDAVAIARSLPCRERERFDKYVDCGLLDRANAIDRLDMTGAIQAARAASASL